MDYLSNKEAVKVIAHNTKNWVKKNAGKIGWGLAAVLSVWALASVNKSKNESAEPEEEKILDSIGLDYSDIDADIFTRIAPLIEDIVLAEGIDESYIEETYEVKHPKFGEPDKGYYSEKKKVSIHIQDVTS